jgi:putative ABC transport system ATP-binding protein
MHIVGFLDRATSGTYRFAGYEVQDLGPDALADLRSRALGFVFQAYNLLPRTTAIENVELPMVYAGVPAVERRRKALAALDAVGLAKYAQHQPNQLSGGQQQRVAIARSIVNDPQLILADEPTGALDTQSSEDVMALFRRLNEERGMTVMLVTHEPDVAAHAKRLVTFRDGRIVSDAPVAAREEVHA